MRDMLLFGSEEYQELIGNTNLLSKQIVRL